MLANPKQTVAFVTFIAETFIQKLYILRRERSAEMI